MVNSLNNNAIDVITVNWNGKDFISQCISSLNEQNYKTLKTVIVDNGSTDGSADLFHKNDKAFQVISLPRNLGFAIANNIALRNTESQYVALLNNDAIAHPLWIQTILNSLQRHPQAGFAASKMIFASDPDTIDRVGDAYTVAGTAMLRGRGQPAEAFSSLEWIFGACAGAAIYRTDMLKDIGLFDEDFFLLYEDVDLSFRAQLKGYKCLYVPDAIVYHKGSASIGHDSPTSVYYSHRNLEWVYIKNMPASLIPLTIVPHLIYVFASFLFFVSRGRGKEFIRAKRDALKGLPRMLRKRRAIQGSRRVSDRYIWSILDRELLFPRLFRRLETRSKPL